MSRIKTHHYSSSPMLRALLAAVALAACGGGEDVTDLVGGMDSEGGEIPEAPSGPTYLVFSTIDTPDGRIGYFVTTPSIEGDMPVDVTRGIEVPGGGQVYAPPGGGYFLVGDGEAPNFTRYDLLADGTLARGETVSFANYGVDTVWRHMIFVDDTKAYFLDMTQVQIIAFNPTSMQVTSAIPVNDFQCAEEQTEFGTPIQRADGFYFPRSCWDLDITSSGSSLVHLDPTTDTVTVTHDDRCMGMQIGFQTDDGDAYWFADHDASVEWSLQNRPGPHDCGLRLRAGETRFDPAWQIDLTTRTGGASAVAAVPAGDSRVWVKVFEPSAVGQPLPMEEVDWTLEAWRWGLLDVATEQPVQRNEASDLVVYYGPPIEVEGRAFSPATTFSDEGDETALVELTSSGIQERLRVRGELRKVFRLR